MNTPNNSSRFTGRLRAFQADDRGLTLVESVVAVTVFALVGVAVLSGMSTAHLSSAETEGQMVAETLARNQMESAFTQPYQAPPASYPAVAAPAGYATTAVAEEYLAGDPDVERVIVTVHHNAETILIVETLRARP